MGAPSFKTKVFYFFNPQHSLYNSRSLIYLICYTFLLRMVYPGPGGDLRQSIKVYRPHLQSKIKAVIIAFVFTS